MNQWGLFFCCLLGSLIGWRAALEALIEPGCHTIGDQIVLGNDGAFKGYVGVTAAGAPNQLYKATEFFALENADKVGRRDAPRKVYLYGSRQLQSLVFEGVNRLNCYRCTGSGGQDPNDRLVECADPLEVNYCATCVRVPCSSIVSVTDCYHRDGGGRAQEPDSVIDRLKLDGEGANLKG